MNRIHSLHSAYANSYVANISNSICIEAYAYITIACTWFKVKALISQHPFNLGGNCKVFGNLLVFFLSTCAVRRAENKIKFPVLVP